MNEVVIVSSVRTPIGSFNGSLSSVPATELGSIAIRGALEKINLNPIHVEEVFMGCVLQANLGQAPSRQAALGAGLPLGVSCTTVNKVCASSMKAISFAMQAIQTGNAECIVAGGMENMSQVPFYMTSTNKNARHGGPQMVDGTARDGLSDAYDNSSMGIAAELCAETHNISREQQDAFAIASAKRAISAWEENKTTDEVIPVAVKDKKGNVSMVTRDDFMLKGPLYDKIPKLRPCFKDNGTVTAANSSSISDGACAIVLMSASKAAELGIAPLARVLACADAAQAPEWFTTAPSLAVPKAVSRAGLSMEDIDFFEVNEAFAVVALANTKILHDGCAQVTSDRVNMHGGAVAIGHPLGVSGGRVVVTLLNVLSQNGGRYGAAGICNGGGGASAIVIERLSDSSNV